MGLWDALYRVVMRRNSVYVTFVVAGAFAGERVRSPPIHPSFILSTISNESARVSIKWIPVVDYGVHKLWEHVNVGVFFS
ncbi:hypothetical protein ACMD2_09773 [Ananas comosus]|uniref:Complex III subunit 9 n=1 Tax=Ananas comosus TaxID=4615 RepID=A0A199UJZ8_ANACO|nr:hypothetical protein ACMD2_09773 [Ananas comosus]